VNEIALAGKIIDFYTDQLKSFGSTAQGVGWKNDGAQLVRFSQLVKVIQSKNNFTINDLGCGAGRLYNYLQTENYEPIMYRGYDILEEMITLAKSTLPSNNEITLTRIHAASEMEIADYTVASGIFNVKFDADSSDWLNHIIATIESMDAKSARGFAFNVLTKYSDSELMQPYLYYADPLYLFDYCKRNFSKNVALLHDYHQFDFTLIVRKA
jgi:SAM-dependent methyltransferase